jgi:hypothetical protein
MPKRHRFLALALSIASSTFAFAQQPPQAVWAGQALCAVTIKGPGYSHEEVHLWRITGAGKTTGNMTIYPTTWSVRGAGSLSRVSGPTRVEAQWTVNGALQDVTIGTTLHSDRITIQRWTNHGPARGALTGTKTTTVNGAGTSEQILNDVQQWAFPVIETKTRSTLAHGRESAQVDGSRGPLAPPGSMGVVKCEWDFTRDESPSDPRH